MGRTARVGDWTFGEAPRRSPLAPKTSPDLSAELRFMTKGFPFPKARRSQEARDSGVRLNKHLRLSRNATTPERTSGADEGETTRWRKQPR